VVTIPPGKHRRPEPETQAPAGMSFTPAGLPQAPVDVAGPATGDSGTWAPEYDRMPGRRDMAGAAFPAANQRPALPDPDWLPSGAVPGPQWDDSPPLHPDHPSAPVPRVRAPLAPAAGGAGRGPARRSSHGIPQSLPKSGPPRLAQRLPGGQPSPGAAARPGPEAYDHEPGQYPSPRAGLPVRPAPRGNRQGQAEAQTRTGLMAPDAGAESSWVAGFARQPGFGYGGQAAVISQEALNQAARQDAAAALREATAIREAAEKEAAHLRAVILSLSEQLSQMSAYITENLASPGGAPPALTAAATAALVTAPQTALPAGPATGPARPAARPTRPASRHARPVTKPGKSSTRPATGTQGRQALAARKMVAPLAALVTVGVARPTSLAGRAKPWTAPTQKRQTRPRQHQAMRVATAAIATLFAFAVAAGATELAAHGFKFFVFRQTGTGETGDHETDQQFLAQQASAAKAAATHTPGRHSTKTRDSDADTTKVNK
jgi:hypothetical protein